MEAINLNVMTVVALLAWPCVGVWLYKTRPIGLATLWTFLGGFLLLPVGASLKIKMFPPVLDKFTIPTFTALIACMLVSRRLMRIGNGFGLTEIITLALIFCPAVSALLNSDPLVYGPVVLPGSGPYDAGSAVVSQFVMLIPFFLGRQFLRGGADTHNVLRVLVIAMLAYSLPMLFEIRMSPQLHRWVYGYAPPSFFEDMRDGGFRPEVFLGHGLPLSFFTMTGVVASAALWRTRTFVTRFRPGGVTAYLAMLLALCKSMGALTFAVVLVPLARWASPRMQMRVALVLTAIALSYPMLRTMNLVPTTSLVDVAGKVSASRALSLQTRFTNEDLLLVRASQRFWFGWGRFGRFLIHDSDGKMVSAPDGHWVVSMGQFGFVGFLAEFGLMALVVVRAASALRYARSAQDQYWLAALTLIVAAYIFNLLPNSSNYPWFWLLVGTLLGRAEALREGARQPAIILNPRLPVGEISPRPT